MGVQIPLFELGVVLFPHMPLPLHVFEERYRAMLRHCDEQGTGFGVVAIREGHEVGGGAIAYDVGTLAQIRRQERAADGRANLLVTGATRFRVVKRVHTYPFPAGEIEYLEDDPGSPADSRRLAAEVRDAFRRYATALQQLAAQQPSVDDVPDDPELLGYLCAAALQVEVPHKQRLLEAPTAVERLRLCMSLLRREGALLERMLAHSSARISGMSPN